MQNKITRWGVGPKFVLISVIYGMTILILNFTYFSSLRFLLIDKWVNIIIGTILILIGVPVFLLPAITIDKYFYKNKLCTTGVYSFIRHPIYGAWISFIVPGIVIIIGSYIGITVPIFMYIVFKILIPKEEKYLEKKFGDEYIEYKKKVGEIFPKLF
ncbi:MAG: isoprenylcysteine carboxylmethyltransferase family protein [archaeon]